MIRPPHAVIVIMILAAGVARSSAQSASGTPSFTTALAEAEQLNRLVVKLCHEGKFEEAAPFAEQCLALRQKALGPMHPDVAQSLNNLALLYQAQGVYGKAEPLYVRALAIYEKAFGPTHPEVATSLNNLALLYQAQGVYGKAEPLYVRALAIYEKAFGPTHPNVASSLNNLGELHDAQGAYGKAEPLLVRALAINEKVLGHTHPDVATSLNNLAVLYRKQGANGKAEPLYIRALAIREKAFGPTHPDVATSLNNLAVLYREQGANGKAEPLLVRALDIREKALGPRHPDVATSLNSLARLYQEQGANGKAEPLLARALDIREKALGPTHPDVAISLNSLAGLYHAQGAYGKAESLYVRALAIREKAFGPRHPDVATSLNSLARLYQEQGANGKAEPLLIRALAIREKALGPTHPDVAISLNSLAGLYQAQGAYAKAEPLYVRALDISEKARGPVHRDVAGSLNNLAGLYQAQGTYGKAEPLYVRSLDISEKVLGPTHPDVATSLNNLAELYQAQGAYGKAEPLYVRAIDIFEKALGPTHPNVAHSLNNLATLYWRQGAFGRALPLESRATEIQERELGVELARLSEPRKRDLMALLQGKTFRVVSLHADAVPNSDHALELALTTVLRRKGRILDSLVDNESTLRTRLAPALRDKLDQLTSARTELVAQLYAPIGPSTTTDRAAIAAVRARIDDLESALSAASAEFRDQAEPITIAKVQAALPQGAALVEFVRYLRFDPRQAQHWQEERYVAYLLTPHGPPQWVALGKAAPINAEVDAMLIATRGKFPKETAKAALQRLDALVFAPIRAHLTGVSHMILAPDGKLDLVPFEALVNPQGHYALENYLVSYLTSGRDLLRFTALNRPRSPAVIVAGPDYGPLPSPGVPGTMSFAPLAGSLAEATDLQEYFATAPLTGRKATKSALAALTGPAMLHIATHGFYARDTGSPLRHPASVKLSTTSAPRASPPLAGSSRFAQRDLSRGMFVDGGASPLLQSRHSEEPADALDRVGLAMAGANQGGDGIVTAREIAGFDWWGTQLVVLSACETGVGAFSFDGIYSLRRALVLAGAASQVVSLWSVSDASTRQMMRDYYGELARGTGRAEAMRQAKLRLMRQPRYAHPYYWAAFIPAGDWRPLDKTVFSPRNPQP